MATTPFTRRDTAAPARREAKAEAAGRALAVLAQMYAYFDPSEPTFTARDGAAEYALVA